ncbi:MAG: HAD hydrolase family protein [Pirellulales bacterium]|nr:HAD hydrolase family protein [Pirellulales bacterium]
MSLEQLCQPIRLILSDVDGVLTDGGIIIDNQGIESKQFHVRDGQGIRLWHKAGYKFGLITLRSSQILKIRVAELGIEIIRQGIEHKLDAMREIIGDLRLAPRQVCYIGDDLPDLALVRSAGLGVAVADACDELCQAAKYVTKHHGGKGAVRETIELILKAQQRWEDLIKD